MSLTFNSGDLRLDHNFQTRSFPNSQSHVSSWELSKNFLLPCWHLKIILEKSNLPSPSTLSHTTLDLHIFVIGPTVLSIIQLEIFIIFYLLSVLFLSSKWLLITKDKPKLLNLISKVLCDLILVYISTFTSPYATRALQTSQTKLLVIFWTHPTQPHPSWFIFHCALPGMLSISAYQNQAHPYK